MRFELEITADLRRTQVDIIEILNKINCVSLPWVLLRFKPVTVNLGADTGMVGWG